MPLTLEEITVHEKRARREIAERECLLAALKVMRTYTAGGDTRASAEPDRLVAALASFTPSVECRELAAPPPAVEPAPPAAAPSPPPRPAPKPRYMHPELEAIGSGHGRNRSVVKWAIDRMTDDYTVRDLDALLTREGRPLRTECISLILALLKNAGEIEQLKRSSGPVPALYRTPTNTTPPVEEPAAAIESQL